MSYADAINLLDMRRAGVEMPQHIVDKALEMTGDKEPELLELILRGAA